MVLFPLRGLFCTWWFIAGASHSFLRPETLRCFMFHSGSASYCCKRLVLEIILNCGSCLAFILFTPLPPSERHFSCSWSVSSYGNVFFFPYIQSSCGRSVGGSFILWLKHWKNEKRCFLRGFPSEVWFEFCLDSGLNVFFYIFTRCNNGSDFRCPWTLQPDGIRRPTTLKSTAHLNFSALCADGLIPRANIDPRVAIWKLSSKSVVVSCTLMQPSPNIWVWSHEWRFICRSKPLLKPAATQLFLPTLSAVGC